MINFFKQLVTEWSPKITIKIKDRVNYKNIVYKQHLNKIEVNKRKYYTLSTKKARINVEK